MKTWVSLRRAAAFAGAALFSGCAASSIAPSNQSPAALRVAISPSGAVRGDFAIQPDRSRSWMSKSRILRCHYNQVLPPCGLLYVSDYSDDDVLVIQRDKIVGKLTGFDGPDGVCSDRAGNVWIVNNLAADIVEYAHGGTEVINTLSDAGEYPLGCAVNPISGALVVTNIYTTGSGPGSIAVYHHASGEPLILSDPEIYYVYFCGFDNAGNLYIDGLNTSGAFTFAELRRNTRHFRNITLSGTIYFPGNIQWDGKHVDVGDQMYNDQVESAIYQTDGAGGKIVGTTVFSGAQDIVGYAVIDNSVIGPDANLGDVGLYPYPAGGDATVRIRRLAHPYGATISDVH